MIEIEDENDNSLLIYDIVNGSVNILLDSEYSNFYINKDQAIKIINHLKEQFEL